MIMMVAAYYNIYTVCLIKSDVFYFIFFYFSPFNLLLLVAIFIFLRES